MLFAGDILGERYKIVREIGRGGMSIVYQADDLRLSGKLWAVKEFTYSNSANDTERREEERAFLRKEAEIMKKLDHPTLPRIVDIIEKNETLYIVMDYIEGVSLDKVLSKRGAVEQEAVIEWGKQLSAALDYMHTQDPPIIYQDMKPSNIMLKPDGTVRIIDFGIAGEYRAGDTDGKAYGTRGYAAPEQESGSVPPDARTDIYSLGVTLHHLVTGKNPLDPPYEIKPIRSYNSKLSMSLEWIIQRCTQLNPKDRFQSCAELSYILENPQIIDVDYLHQLKKKRNIFILSVAMVFVFSLLGLVSMQMKRAETDQLYEEYKSWENIEGYTKALELKQIPEAYENLAMQLREKVREIYPEDTSEGYTDADNQILDVEITTSFTSGRLSALKEEDLEVYIKVNYELGRLYWNYYQGTPPTAAMAQASQYFGAVIVAEETREDPEAAKAVLGAAENELTRNYYVTGYFLYEKALWSTDADDGRLGDSVSDALLLAMGLDVDDSADLVGVYEIFWESLQGVKDSLSDTSAVSEQVQIDTLYRVLYIYHENCNTLKSKSDSTGDPLVTAEDAEAFYMDIYENVKRLQEADYSYSGSGGSIDDLLVAVEKEIETIYGVDIDP